MTSTADVERLLRAAGFTKQRQKGSHIRYAHEDGRKTTVPAGRKDIRIGTLKSIEQQSSLKIIQGKGE